MCTTDSMEQGRSWEADSHSAVPNISYLLLEPGSSLPCSQEPARRIKFRNVLDFLAPLFVSQVGVSPFVGSQRLLME